MAEVWVMVTEVGRAREMVVVEVMEMARAEAAAVAMAVG